MKVHHLYSILFLIILISCNLNESIDTNTSAPNHLEALVNSFPNVLNYKGVPDSTTDRSVYAFTDMGAWHGYALPTAEDKAFTGSFIGPYILTQDNGVWINDCLSKLEIFNLKQKEKINLEEATIVETNSFPNKLQQIFQTKSPALLIETQLIFVSKRTALIKLAIQNQSKDMDLELAVRWVGDSFLEGVSFSKKSEGILVDFGKNKHVGWISPYAKNGFDTKIEGEGYSLQLQNKKLVAQEKWETYLSHSFCFSEEERLIEAAKLENIYKNPNTLFSENETRWNEKIQKIIATLGTDFNSEAHQRIAVKCLQTLNGNWRSAAGFLKHDGLFPSYNYEWFNGFWSWDSWKHAVAIAQYDTELAQNQIHAMYDFQDEMGMIADCVYRDNLIEEHNWRDTKPPLSAWAVWEVFQYSKDEDFLQTLFPKIEKYHSWWYKYRDVDKNGLCEYGSTDGSLIAAKWESGMDNAVRFDDAKMIKNGLQGGSMNRESVDLNSYLFAEKQYLAKIANHLGEKEKALEYEKEAKALQQTINNVFYDKENGWYFDVDIESKKQLKVFGAEGWIPLWAKIATPEQAAKMKEIMMDTTKFAVYIPFPTLAANHPKFKPEGGYWRGPVWLDQAWFAISGLKNYGYEKEATQFSHHLFDRLEGLKDDDLPIRENYHPLTGAGLESNHFSWSAAHLLMLLTDN